jgi:hypothetical protein
VTPQAFRKLKRGEGVTAVDGTPVPAGTPLSAVTIAHSPQGLAKSPLDRWRETLAEHDDDAELKRDLTTLGEQRGWVTKGGTLVPPGTEPPAPHEELNDAIRRAAGREG